jgi:hypothetical protein
MGLLWICLPISAFWLAFEVTKLNDGTKDIMLAIRVFKNEELNITVAD